MATLSGMFLTWRAKGSHRLNEGFGAERSPIASTKAAERSSAYVEAGAEGHSFEDIPPGYVAGVNKKHDRVQRVTFEKNRLEVRPRSGEQQLWRPRSRRHSHGFG